MDALRNLEIRITSRAPLIAIETLCDTKEPRGALRNLADLAA